ncbi:Fur family transcriptional regulator [Amycolatopsis orientalis]|uniref:Fur family transcriptional regulator n=1 Tax=Amycolatopsis orientalis TaxID=31958 RepID=UPI00039E03DC|nr:transcriptional repressor [Amycolatopsis orientalis]
MTGSGARRSRYETRQRRAVLAELEQAAQFLSVQALHARMTGAGQKVALSTVYRALRYYTEAGQATAVLGPNGERRYRRADAQGGYLVCRRCTETVPIDLRVVLAWAASVAAERAFSRVAVVVFVTGVCRRCALSTSARSLARVDSDTV